MAEENTDQLDKPALVLHLAGGGEPLLFALPPGETSSLEKKLPQLVRGGGTESIRTKEGSTVTVQFASVAVAYIDDLHRKGKVFGLH